MSGVCQKNKTFKCMLNHKINVKASNWKNVDWIHQKRSIRMIFMMFECILKNEMHKINHDSFFLWSPLFNRA